MWGVCEPPAHLRRTAVGSGMRKESPLLVDLVAQMGSSSLFLTSSHPFAHPCRIPGWLQSPPPPRRRWRAFYSAPPPGSAPPRCRRALEGPPFAPRPPRAAARARPAGRGVGRPVNWHLALGETRRGKAFGVRPRQAKGGQTRPPPAHHAGHGGPPRVAVRVLPPRRRRGAGGAGDGAAAAAGAAHPAARGGCPARAAFRSPPEGGERMQKDVGLAGWPLARWAGGCKRPAVRKRRRWCRHGVRGIQSRPDAPRAPARNAGPPPATPPSAAPAARGARGRARRRTPPRPAAGPGPLPSGAGRGGAGRRARQRGGPGF